MQLFIIYSYLTDGLANAGEALSGRYTGANDRRGLIQCVQALFCSHNGRLYLGIHFRRRMDYQVLYRPSTCPLPGQSVPPLGVPDSHRGHAGHGMGWRVYRHDLHTWYAHLHDGRDHRLLCSIFVHQGFSAQRCAMDGIPVLSLHPRYRADSARNP